jgi:malic enzyme
LRSSADSQLVRIQPAAAATSATRDNPTSAAAAYARVCPKGICSTAKDAIVFAMANPTPEIAPEEIEHLVAVVDARATTITREMELAAAHALARVVEPDHVEAVYVIPSVFDRRVAPTVAEAVARAAEVSGVGRARYLGGHRLAESAVNRGRGQGDSRCRPCPGAGRSVAPT